MENTANNSYSHPEFDILLSEIENQKCFDCGNSPTSWASVNNSIYLCMDCAGIHRGFGVNISYIRSNLIDKWNETQISFLKVGGNKRLRDLLNMYEIPKSTRVDVIYNSKLLNYHRNQIKNDITNGGQLIMPNIEDCLEPFEPKIQSQNKSFYSVGSNGDFNDDRNKNNVGYFSYFGSVLTNAYEKSKEVAYNVKDKVKDMDIGTKIKQTGTKTFEVLKDTSIVVKEKGGKTVEVLRDTTSKVVDKSIRVGGLVKEKGTEIANSDTVKNLKHKVEDGVGYFYGKFFGKNNQGDNNHVSNSQNANPQNENEDVLIENEFTKPDLSR